MVCDSHPTANFNPLIGPRAMHGFLRTYWLTVGGLVLLGFAAWVLGITQDVAGRGRRIGRSAAVAAFLAARERSEADAAS